MTEIAILSWALEDDVVTGVNDSDCSRERGVDTGVPAAADEWDAFTDACLCSDDSSVGVLSGEMSMSSDFMAPNRSNFPDSTFLFYIKSMAEQMRFFIF